MCYGRERGGVCRTIAKCPFVCVRRHSTGLSRGERYVVKNRWVYRAESKASAERRSGRERTVGVDDVRCLVSRVVLLVAYPDLSARIDSNYIVRKLKRGTWTQNNLLGTPRNYARTAPSWQLPLSEQQGLTSSGIERSFVISCVVGRGSVRNDRPVVIRNVNPRGTDGS